MEKLDKDMQERLGKIEKQVEEVRESVATTQQTSAQLLASQRSSAQVAAPVSISSPAARAVSLEDAAAAIFAGLEDSLRCSDEKVEAVLGKHTKGSKPSFKSEAIGNILAELMHINGIAKTFTQVASIESLVHCGCAGRGKSDR